MVYLVLLLILSISTIYLSGRWLYKIMMFKSSWTDSFFLKIEKSLYRFLGEKHENQSAKKYFYAMFKLNMVLAVCAFIVLLLPFNGLTIEQALHTAISFITNTNLQHYAPESQLGLVSQMLAIVMMMYVSCASGVAVGFAFIRGLVGKPMGNFYQDFIRIMLRYLIPVTFVMAIVLVWQGVPQTFVTSVQTKSIEGVSQGIAMGPVALFTAIKHVGTNGGGFFSANAAMPYENPTLITNTIYMLAMIAIPGGFLYAFGLSAKTDTSKHLQSNPLYVLSALFFVAALALLYFSEMKGNPLFAGLHETFNLEGKELRFGILHSSLFTSVSSAFTTGAVNTMYDSLTPLGGLVPMVLMMLNVVFGGSGVGFMNLSMYVLLTVFISGLMIGRTPEYLGKKIESKEMKRVAIVIIIHPLLILGFSALALVVVNQVSNSHQLSRVLYEFTSASANNGSGFEGLQDNTMFFNLTTAFVMFIARYVTIYLQLQVAGMLRSKKTLHETVGTLNTNTMVFTIALGVIIISISALTFFPVLILGPIHEALLLVRFI